MCKITVDIPTLQTALELAAISRPFQAETVARRMTHNLRASIHVSLLSKQAFQDKYCAQGESSSKWIRNRTANVEKESR